MPHALLKPGGPLIADAAAVGERWLLRGLVQGVGLRPVLARLASDLGVAGAVRNAADGVEIEVEAPADVLNTLYDRLLATLPPAARVETAMRTAARPSGRIGFAIESSRENSPFDRTAAAVPPDRAICHDCLHEVRDASDRRRDYPFSSCADCGPRFSILEQMPFDRQGTTMGAFELCSACRREYESRDDRRFHAQTTACAACGPQAWLSSGPGGPLATRDRAISLAATALVEGRILAIRGVGGYQLLCDATNAAAVERLRIRKRRPAKPFAVLIESIDQAERLGWLDDVERKALESPANPIVVVRRRHDAGLDRAVCGEFDTVGLLLPTTALHAMLARRVGRPLVCTSGNVEGEPLAFEPAAAERELAGAADLWLHHDRPIRRPIDDSVVRVIAGRLVSLRLARGLAPLPLSLPLTTPFVALGGHQHAACAVANGVQAALGPHLGDLDGCASRSRYLAQLDDLQSLYGVAWGVAIHDRHPDYFTTAGVAPRFARSIAIEHHRAHAAAALLEAGWLRDVACGDAALAVTFDGTGYGADGAIWGGEWLLMHGSESTRVGSLAHFRLPGGTAAVFEPWRLAAALIAQALDRDSAIAASSRWGVASRDVVNVLAIAYSARWSPVCTSGGRLFDAAAAIALDLPIAAFEGEPAMRLEAACDRTASGAYRFEVIRGPLATLDWRPALRALVADRAAGEPPGAMAMRFHRGLAEGIARLCRSHSPLPVVLGGGVFQNRILVEELLAAWRDSDQRLALPGAIPPGDGGLAAGQLAAAWLQNEGHTKGLIG